MVATIRVILTVCISFDLVSNRNEEMHLFLLDRETVYNLSMC